MKILSQTAGIVLSLAAVAVYAKDKLCEGVTVRSVIQQPPIEEMFQAWIVF